MNRQNPKFRQEFSYNFLNSSKQNTDSYDDQHYKPAGSGHNYDATSQFRKNWNSYNQSGSRDTFEGSSQQKPNEQYPRRPQEYASVGDFNGPSEHRNPRRQRQQHGYDNSVHYTSSHLAGGDGNTQGARNQQLADTKVIHSSGIQQEETRNSDAVYNKRSNSSSRFSNSSKETAVERSVGRKGKQLLRLTLSKANLIQTVEEGISDLQPKHCLSNQKPADKLGRRASNDTYNCESESPNACSSPSAGVINNKIIHPMVTKFRLLYLNNIKEEVSIMQELEALPHKLNEVCKKLESKD